MEPTVTADKLPRGSALPSAGKPAPLMPVHAATAYSPLRRLTRQRWFIALRSFAVFTGLWWLFSAWNDNPLQLPSPLAVFEAVWELAASGELFEHAGISTRSEEHTSELQSPC